MNQTLESAVTPRGTDKAKVIQVIETRAIKGAGIPNDPVRELVQYWDFEGRLLAEIDPLADWKPPDAQPEGEQ